MCLSPWRGPGRYLLGLAFLPLLGIMGCARPTGTVTGKVYYKTKLLKGGTVTFVGPDGKTATGQIQEDGSYTVEKAPVGEVKVGVDNRSLKPRPGIPRYRPPSGSQAGYTPPDPAEQAKRYVPIPDQYTDPTTSGKTLTVTSGKQEQDIKLP